MEKDPFVIANITPGKLNALVKNMMRQTGIANANEVVRLFNSGNFELKVTNHIIDCDKAPLILYDGWKVEEHIKGGQFAWNPEKVKLFLSVNQKYDTSTSMKGEELRKELKDQPVVNANVLDYLLDHPNLIPEEWKVEEKGKTRYVFFWGTIYRDPEDDLFVRYLSFDGSHWKQEHYWLYDGFNDNYSACVFTK